MVQVLGDFQITFKLQCDEWYFTEDSLQDFFHLCQSLKYNMKESLGKVPQDLFCSFLKPDIQRHQNQIQNRLDSELDW